MIREGSAGHALAGSALAGLLALGCAPAEPPAETLGAGRRIVSLDYCADQFVLALADRSRVVAVSTGADTGFSYLREQARGLPTVRPRAEDVLALSPDLVVRSYGGGPNARAFFERAGIAVHQIGFADDVEDVRTSIRAAARALGAVERGEALVTDMDRRLAAVDPLAGLALYTTPSGVTAGSGTLVHAMLEVAGLTNFQAAPGWRSIPLERMAYEQPDLIASASFGDSWDHDDAWTPMRHPVARRMSEGRPVVALEGATTSCGGWFLADAVERLASARASSSGPRP